MKDDLITLATYRFAVPAEVARVALEQEGIRVFIMDSNLVTTNFFLGNAVGYIKLQVPRSQSQAALAILQRQPSLLDSTVGAPDSEADDVARCLSCHAILSEESDHCPACGWSYGDDESEDRA